MGRIVVQHGGQAIDGIKEESRPIGKMGLLTVAVVAETTPKTDYHHFETG